MILQSAPRMVCRDQARGSCDFVVAGPLRAVKEPLTLMAAARALPAEPPMRVIHIGDPLDEALGHEARRTMANTVSKIGTPRMNSGITRGAKKK